MATKWLLLEMFEGRRPTVIAVGRSPKKFLPLDRIINHRLTLSEAKAAIAEAAASYRQVDRISSDGSRRTVVVPLPISRQRLHGVMLWSGPPSDALPPRDRAGAWYFNITTGTSTRSDDLLDLMGFSPEEYDAVREHSIAAVFADPLTPNYSEQGTALARIVRAEQGQETQQVWTIRRPDGELRAAHFSCRMVHEPGPDGDIQRLLRGITHDIGPATETPVAPPPTILEHRVLEASADDGEYRVIMNTRTLQMLRWIGPPMPGIAWEALEGEPSPAIHPDDIAVARVMSDGLREGRTAGRVRVRALDGSWTALDTKAVLMLLDQSTTAALVTIRLAEPNGSDAPETYF
ncbi:GAF domain-containing protein [Nocardia terpenica]|uniref:GAF domain-containing protein n=1 Tax=Nocardia terpenica TaxID=455432 RepID=UPI001E476D1F|nr:GAF domain-containing protein [Nocardia terpenica]